MGRLRNLSASFKAAAFPSASSSSPNSYRTSPESPDRVGDKTTASPAVVREASAQSVPESSSAAARPTSMIYTPPTIGSATSEEIEELKPVFSYLSSHANKLYQEGYFLKLDDLDTNGKPNPNRVWTECFAQLVGTILSFWDAEALDAAGQDGEVAPSFINLADASIKMIETLPTRNQDVQPLQNVLSVSTAGKNRYLLHFNSLHSLTQWTAGIRLAMFENASLHELYTGSLIAGKGRNLNSINQIMMKNRFRVEDWARVRFGAGTPWRRCWCVIEPPDEKEWQRSQKKMGKRSAYEKATYPKGDIKFYDTKKIKKAAPIATITNAYSAYAIYPQSKALINESTLVKLEGKITIHSQPESKTEGFVFVMPEVHPAVSGFEMMLRWLLPVYDTFSLYGRPVRLIPDTLDTKSLMFAMPKERRYGYLDIIDIAALIHTEGSDKWSEGEWRKKMKEAVSRRMSMQVQGRASNVERVRGAPDQRRGLQFSDSASTHSVDSSHKHSQSTENVFATPKKTYTAPAHIAGSHYHARSASENTSLSPMKRSESRTKQWTPSRLSEKQITPEEPDLTDLPPTMPQQRRPLKPRANEAGYMDSANSSDSEMHGHVYAEDVSHDLIQSKSVLPVAAPPDFQHQPNEQPKRRPTDRPEMRREKSRMSDATLAQMNPRLLEELRREDAARSQNEQAGAAASAAAYAWRQNGSDQSRGVNETPTDVDGTLTNPQRPVVVAFPPSTSSTSCSIQKKLSQSSTHLDTTDNDLTRPQPDRAISETSNYPMPNHDRDSSPDYASRHSKEQPRPKERVRGGTRKVVGNADETQPVPELGNLHVDSGQSQRLTPESSQPSTSRPVSAGGRKSPFDSLGRSDSATGRRSPFDSLGQPTGRSSPLNPFGLSSPARTPEKQSPVDRPSHSRSQSYAWMPGTYVPDAQEGMSAEEFVQQRSAMAQRPQPYVAHRALSVGRIDQIKGDQRPQTPTSPTKSSSKRLQKRSLSSRNTSGGSIDYTAHLSAREQEHVARMTGGPLLNMNTQSRTPDPAVGLIGAISAREQERQNIKQGVQGQMVQAAIDQRKRESRVLDMHRPQSHQRPQSQSLMYQQAYQTGNPYTEGMPTEYGLQQHQTQQPQQYQPQPQQQSMFYQQTTQPGTSSQYCQQQPMYAVQQQNMQPQDQSQRLDSRTQQGYPAPSMHARTQSNWSQYGGFYAPQK